MSTQVWLVGLTLGNTLVGVLAFGDPFSMMRVAGIGAAILALVLLTA